LTNCSYNITTCLYKPHSTHSLVHHRRDPVNENNWTKLRKTHGTIPNRGGSSGGLGGSSPPYRCRSP
jgi:hypothetical protein